MKTVAVGSGAALKLGEEGNADVLMVHSPAAEKTFMEGGFGVNRQLLMHNMFLVVGPPTDPAGISGMTSAKDAFTKIADAKSTFVSRGDGSGTETKELGHLEGRRHHARGRLVRPVRARAWAPRSRSRPRRRATP